MTSTFSLTGMTAVITGGTAGIGRAVAARFAQSGARVVIIGRREARAIAEQVGAVAAIQADCSIEGEVARALREAHSILGPIDILVNNAGIENTGPSIFEASGAELNRVFAINTFAVFHGIKHGQELLKDGASIINTSSIAASISVPGYSQYSASKAAVISLTRTAALELAPRRIRVNAVCPGSVYSEMLPLDHPEIPLVSTMCPLGRVASTEDIVGIYHFLAASESAYVTGQAIAVDGGMLAGVGFGTIGAILSTGNASANEKGQAVS